MSRETIKKLLDEKGKTSGQVALQLKVSYQAIYQAMDGKCSRRVRVGIAKVLGRSPSSLWVGEVKPQVLAGDDYEYMHGSQN